MKAKKNKLLTMEENQLCKIRKAREGRGCGPTGQDSTQALLGASVISSVLFNEQTSDIEDNYKCHRQQTPDLPMTTLKLVWCTRT